MSGLVWARCGVGAEGVEDELRFGEIGVIQIPASYARTANVDFSRNSHRNRLQIAVENVNERIVDGASDGQRRRQRTGSRRLGGGGDDAGFGGPVGVDPAHSRARDLAPRFERLNLRLLSADNYET